MMANVGRKGESFDATAERMSILTNYKGEKRKNKSWKKFNGKWFQRDNFLYRVDKIDYEKRKAQQAGNRVRVIKVGKWFSLFRRPKKEK